MASPLTVYSLAADSYLSNMSATYATARSGGGTFDGPYTSANLPYGQKLVSTTYQFMEIFLSWDTSFIPDTATVTGADIGLYHQNKGVTQDFVIQVRARDWGTSVTTADFVAGADLSALTLLASRTTVGIGTNAYWVLTSEAALLSAINKTGETRVVVTSDRMAAGNTPTTSEFMAVWLNEKGAGYQPRLVVTYTEASSAVPVNLLKTHIFNKGVIQSG